MADAAITETIRTYLRPIDAKKGFHLEFVYNKTLYKTYFSAHHTDEEISVSNPCLTTAFEYTYEGEKRNKFNARLISDSDELKCFYPILRTDPRGKPGIRTTAAGVLQTLATKLSLAFPTVSDYPVTTNDGAQNSRIMISPFHILRGGNAFYEKYGYRSDPITHLKEKIKTFKWRECNAEIRSVITDCTGRKDWSDETFLMKIMNEISWEDEKTYNNAKGSVSDDGEEDFIHPSLSYRVFRHFATIAGGIPFEKTDQFKTDTIWEFTLNRESEEWRRCDSELVFTKFVPKHGGGSRGNRRRKRRVTRRRRALRVHTRNIRR